jgi:hypothetical protein
VWDLRHEIEAQPKRGKANVLKESARPQLYNRNHAVLAVYDQDRARDLVPELVQADRSGCKRLLAAALKEKAGQPAKLAVIFIHQNMETVVAAVQRCAGQTPAASPKPRPEDRDRILNQATFGERRLRDCVLADVPSLAYLVEKLLAALVLPTAT